MNLVHPKPIDKCQRVTARIDEAKEGSVGAHCVRPVARSAALPRPCQNWPTAKLQSVIMCTATMARTASDNRVAPAMSRAARCDRTLASVSTAARRRPASARQPRLFHLRLKVHRVGQALIHQHVQLRTALLRNVVLSLVHSRAFLPVHCFHNCCFHDFKPFMVTKLMLARFSAAEHGVFTPH